MKKDIQEMPKVILHLHLDGSLRPTTVQEWINELLEKKVKLEDVEKMLMVEKGCRDLNQYLEKFDTPVKMLQTAEHIKRATYELYEDLSKQNVKYAEIRFAPSKHILGGLSYDEVVKASIDGLQMAKEKFDIDGNLILCCMRGDNNENDNLETVEVARRFLEKGVCAVDLAGAEALYKTEDFENIFQIAKEYNVPFTIHAGEADGPKSVKKALEFGAERIGHGVRSIEDKELINELAEKQIPLEVCPISNLQTQAVKGKHPIEELFKKGICITVSTDNNTVSNTNILEEYEYILANTGLKIDDLISMNINAARNIFGSQKQKTDLMKIISEYKDKSEEHLSK